MTGPRIPRIREHCLTGFNKDRPCMWIRCKYHMLWLCYARESFFKRESFDQVWERLESLSETCVLDIASENGATLERIGSITGLTRERIRQIEYLAIKKVHHPVKFAHIEMFRNEVVETDDLYFNNLQRAAFLNHSKRSTCHRSGV